MPQDKLKTPEVEAMLNVFAQVNNADEVYALMLDLCTVREIAEMAQRLQVAGLLANKTSYTDIQDLTGASATTISRVSKCLNYGSGGYEVALQVLAAANSKE